MSLPVGLVDVSDVPPELVVPVGLVDPVVSVGFGVPPVPPVPLVPLVPVVEESGVDEEALVGDDPPGEVPGVDAPGEGGDDSPGEGVGDVDAAAAIGSTRAAATADAPDR
ncbi:hypothetical protein [Streptomyces collinus]|uniref:hypothetical protein n=1 Tax=Streptomyces collinus TaxID=42684 RepID=UPI002941C81E|nr:hypothetical protein [Streptomyces collinus]